VVVSIEAAAIGDWPALRVAAGGVATAVEAALPDAAVGGAAEATLSGRATERFVESTVAVVGRRLPLFWKNRGGTTMTIAVSSNARKKRLSIELMGPEARGL
jgi:hypothetical protein